MLLHHARCALLIDAAEELHQEALVARCRMTQESGERCPLPARYVPPSQIGSEIEATTQVGELGCLAHENDRIVIEYTSSKLVGSQGRFSLREFPLLFAARQRNSYSPPSILSSVKIFF